MAEKCTKEDWGEMTTAHENNFSCTSRKLGRVEEVGVEFGIKGGVDGGVCSLSVRGDREG